MEPLNIKMRLEFFIQNNGGHISVDNRFEIPMLEEVAAKLDRKQPVIMRINLDVGAETHPMGADFKNLRSTVRYLNWIC